LEQLVGIISSVALCYLLAGFVFALAFVMKGAEKLDETAHGVSFMFRLFIFPGSVLLWPLLLIKWLKA